MEQDKHCDDTLKSPTPQNTERKTHMKALLIDANSIINRAFYGIRELTTSEGVFTNAVYGFITTLLNLKATHKPDKIFCAFDLPSPTFRHERFTDYKAGRSAMPDELRAQFPLIRELIPLFGAHIMQCEGYEADDILGTLSRLAGEQGDTAVIATGDRDSFQLVTDSAVVSYRTSKMGEEVMTTTAIKEKYGITPPQLIDVKALMGDSSDNIPGVKGVGEKTALALISEFGSLDGVYENIDSPSIKKGVREKLGRDREQAYMSYELAEICTTVPGIVYDCDDAQADRAALTAFLTRLELRSLLKRVDELVPVSEGGVATSAEELPAHSADFLNILPEFSLVEGEVAVSVSVKQRFADALYIYADGKAHAITDKTMVDTAVRELLTGDMTVVTTDAKTLYYHGITLGVEPKKLLLDISIAAYILNPLTSTYNVSELCTVHGVDYEYAESMSADCIYLSALWRKLTAAVDSMECTFLLHEIELPLSLVLASVEYEGFLLDTEGLTVFGEQIKGEIDRLTAAIYDLAEEEFNINSPSQLGVILFDKIGLPTRKKTKSGYSTNAEVLESLSGKHPIVDYVLEYRKLTKLMNTYVTGLLRLVGEDGRIHTLFKQTETRTGRISSTDPNMQNIPIRTEIGSKLRAFFVAGSGNTLIDCDYSQIELRVLAHIADDENMQSAFSEGEDIHRKTASQVFSMPPEFVTPAMRSSAKAVNFGIVYGIGAFSLSQDIGVSVAEAGQYIENYLDGYKNVAKYMEDTVQFAKDNGYVKTLYGRRRPVPEVSAKNKNLEAAGKRIAMNTPIQGTAADIIKLAMVKVYNRLKSEGMKARLILQVHDELIVEAPISEAEAVKRIVTEEMENAVTLKVPLLCEAGVGENWLVAH